MWLFKEYFIYSIFAIFVIQKVQIKTVHLLKKDGLSSGFCAHPLSIRETISARWGISDGKLSSLVSGRCPCDTPYIICKGLVTSAKANGDTLHSSEAYYGLMHSSHSNLTQMKIGEILKTWGRIHYLPFCQRNIYIPAIPRLTGGVYSFTSLILGLAAWSDWANGMWRQQSKAELSRAERS